MSKRISALAVVALLAGSGLASAEPIQRVDDPTPNKQFTGSYDCSYYTYDAQGNATKVTKSCESKGYVAVYDDGIVACNGNEALKRPDNGQALQGYVWIGPAHAPKGSTTFAGPQNAFGAGNNLAADNEATRDQNEAHGPCED